jgi:hypothetical protein
MTAREVQGYLLEMYVVEVNPSSSAVSLMPSWRITACTPH